MPKIECICGNVIGLGEIPSPNQELMISDIEFDKFQGQIDSEELFMAMTLVVKCLKCERMYIFKDGYEKPPIIYRKEYL